MGIQRLEKKIIDRDRAAEIGKESRDAGKILVFTNGCFDLVHPGHIDLLIKARLLGDSLMVGLNTDASVKRFKGESRPIVDEASRALVIAALEVVDWVVLFDEDTPVELITAVLPKILVKGGDYTPETVIGRDIVEANDGRVEIIPFAMDFSTSSIIEKLTEDLD